VNPPGESEGSGKNGLNETAPETPAAIATVENVTEAGKTHQGATIRAARTAASDGVGSSPALAANAIGIAHSGWWASCPTHSSSRFVAIAIASQPTGSAAATGSTAPST
jgi:hypothetical protein